MKKILFMCLFVLSGTMAFAQFVNINSNSTASGDVTGYNRVYAAFNVGSISADIMKLKSESTTSYGLTIGYAYGYDITKQKMPLYLELGGELTYMSASASEVKNYDDYDDYYKMEQEGTLNMFSFSVPVNLTYIFKSGSIDIAPLLGLNFKYNLVASGTVDTYEYYDGKLDDKQSSNVDLFDENDMRGNIAERFQIGLNLGCNVTFKNKIVCGYRFQPDFTKLFDNEIVKVSNNVHFLSIGYRF